MEVTEILAGAGTDIREVVFMDPTNKVKAPKPERKKMGAQDLREKAASVLCILTHDFMEKQGLLTGRSSFYPSFELSTSNASVYKDIQKTALLFKRSILRSRPYSRYALPELMSFVNASSRSHVTLRLKTPFYHVSNYSSKGPVPVPETDRYFIIATSDDKPYIQAVPEISNLYIAICRYVRKIDKLCLKAGIPILVEVNPLQYDFNAAERTMSASIFLQVKFQHLSRGMKTLLVTYGERKEFFSGKGDKISPLAKHPGEFDYKRATREYLETVAKVTFLPVNRVSPDFTGYSRNTMQMRYFTPEEERVLQTQPRFAPVQSAFGERLYDVNRVMGPETSICSILFNLESLNKVVSTLLRKSYYVPQAFISGSEAT